MRGIVSTPEEVAERLRRQAELYPPLATPVVQEANWVKPLLIGGGLLLVGLILYKLAK